MTNFYHWNDSATTRFSAFGSLEVAFGDGAPVLCFAQ